MNRESYDIVIIGCGIAGLTAGLRATEMDRSVVLLEKAPEENRGGHTQFAESFRIPTADVDVDATFNVEDYSSGDFYSDIMKVTNFRADQELAVCPYSPLAGGFLTGKYERVGDGTYDIDAPADTRADFDEMFTDWYVSERGWHVLDAVRAVADEADATPAQVALRWLMDQPEFDCVPIVGARTVDQLDENLDAIDLSITDEQFDRIFEARYDEDGDLYETNA